VRWSPVSSPGRAVLSGARRSPRRLSPTRTVQPRSFGSGGPRQRSRHSIVPSSTTRISSRHTRTVPWPSSKRVASRRLWPSRSLWRDSIRITSSKHPRSTSRRRSLETGRQGAARARCTRRGLLHEVPGPRVGGVGADGDRRRRDAHDHGPRRPQSDHRGVRDPPERRLDRSGFELVRRGGPDRVVLYRSQSGFLPPRESF
jgi:hypothetical protein